MTDDPIAACAALVQRADPDRFRATMAAPVPARRVLFPLYAFNAEVARAPWVTAEPMIAEMRLQWWRDALDEIATGGPARRHEVVTPLARILSPAQARLLDDLVAARSWDIYKDPFETPRDLHRYLDHTSAHLVCVAGQALGADDDTALRDFGWAAGLANWLAAVPDLTALKRRPLPDPSPGAIADLAREGLTRLDAARAAPVPKPARPALLAGWQARNVLTRAARAPEKVLSGQLRPSPARAHVLLMKQALTGRF